MEIYRQELIETQKARTSLLKWKIAIVSVLAAVGLGIMFPNTTTTQRGVLLCLIPLACLYVDMLHMSLGLRIHGIAAFLREKATYVNPDNEHFRDYEQFVHDARKAAKKELPWVLRRAGLQRIVLLSSSWIIIGCVFFCGLAYLLYPPAVHDAASSSALMANVAGWIIIGSSLVSIALYWLLLRDYATRRDVMEAMGKGSVGKDADLKDSSQNDADGVSGS
jgi:hypothetical protein